MNTKQEKQPDYVSYLIRMWRAPAESGPPWRASLEEILTQEVHGFKDLESLFSFLLAQTGQQGRQSPNVKLESHTTYHESQIETS